jgi:high-affinity iron transporter
MGQELFNAAILGVAVVMLTWHNVWMARRGREIAVEMRAIGQAVAEGSKPLLALAVVVGVAVLREGSEVALFLYGVAASDGGSALGLATGGGLGAAVCLVTYLDLVRIPPRALFATTTVLITLLAAGMAAQAVAFLERANWLASLDTVVWDSELAVVRSQHSRSRLAHADRLYRSADANAALGLSCRYSDNRLADVADRGGARGPCRSCGLERDG